MMVILLFILILSVFQVTMIDYLYNNPTFYQLDAYTWESDDFRSLKLGKMVVEWDLLDYDTLTSLMVEHQYDLTGVTDPATHTDRLLKVKPAEYRKLRQAYETILTDLKYFPIPQTVQSGSPDIAIKTAGWIQGLMGENVDMKAATSWERNSPEGIIRW